MDHKQAANVLINLLKKHPLSAEEKQAVEIAIGILAWTALTKSHVKKLKDKQESAIK